MSTFQIIAVLVGIVITAAGTYAAARYAGKSSVRAKEIDVKAAAYTVAQAISSESIEWLRGQITEMKTEYAELKSELGELKSSHGDQSKELRELRAKTELIMSDLQVAVSWFEQFLVWERDGSPPPRPDIPPELRKYMEPHLIRNHQRQQQQSGDLKAP